METIGRVSLKCDGPFSPQRQVRLIISGAHRFYDFMFCKLGGFVNFAFKLGLGVLLLVVRL